jgi:hypothetical protein
MPENSRFLLSAVTRAVRLPVLLRALGLGLLLALVAFPAAASADVQTIDFDSTPPSLGAPVNAVGDIGFPLGLGLRPYRRDVGARAHSGTTVADLGECVAETELLGGNAGDCEFFQARTTGVLARTAKTVTVFAGRFGPVRPLDAPEQATLLAFDADDNLVASSGARTITAAGFDTRLSVTSAAGDIASFRIFATGGVDGANEFVSDLGIDDLSVTFADGGDPDFSLSTTSQILALVQGEEVEVPVRINRLNGSSGPVDLTVSGLPRGIQALPTTIPAGQSEATIALSAAATAPSTDFVVLQAKITADPRGDLTVAPAPRKANLNFRVARDYELFSEKISEDELVRGNVLGFAAPDCAPVDLPVTISRDIAFHRTIKLSLREKGEGDTGLPQGLDAEILPSPLIEPGGALAAERSIRLRAGPSANGEERHFLILEARVVGDPSAIPHKLPIELVRSEPLATINTGRPGWGLARTGRYGDHGTTKQIHGTGFCAGTTIDVGSKLANVPTRMIDDHTLEFEVPGNALSGELVIRPPGGLPPYRGQDELTVDSFRNVNGFQFANTKIGHISLSEFTRAFGADDLFVKVNPCWPWGSCDVITGFLSPTALLNWGVTNAAVPVINGFSRTGHCFGMSLAIRQFLSREESLREFRANGGSRLAQSVFELGTRKGPDEDLESFLDAEQMKEFSSEMIDAYFNRPKSFEAQLQTIEEEFSHQRPTLIHLGADNPFHGHVVLAYDMKREGNGVDLYTYENNSPFVPEEEGGPDVHESALARSIVHVDLEREVWAMPRSDGYRAGGRGTLWAMRKGDIPADPSIAGVGTLKHTVAWLIFGSTGGAVGTVGVDTFMPLFGSSPEAGGATGGSWIGEAGDPLDVKFVGKKSGSYHQAYMAPGFVASAEDVVTDKGVRDEIRGAGHTITFESGADRPLRLDLANDAKGAPSAATLSTHVSAGDADRAGLAGDAVLTFVHDGAPTSLRFTLTTVHRNGGPATFVSPPVAIRDGDRLRATPLGRGGDRVRLRISNHGQTRTRVLHTRARSRGRIVLGAAKLSGRRLSVGVKVSGLGRRALGGVALRLMRGKHVLARKAVALKRAAGAHRISWRLPRSARSGRYRVVADARVLTGPAPGVTVSASTTARHASAIRLR